MNRDGFTLIEIVIGLGLVSILALVQASLGVQVSKTMSGAELKAHYISTALEVEQALHDKNASQKTFVDTGATIDPVDPRIRVVDIKDVVGNSIVKIGQNPKIGWSFSIPIESMTLMYPTTGCNDSEPECLYRVKASLHFEKMFKDRSFASAYKIKPVSFYLKTEGSDGGKRKITGGYGAKPGEMIAETLVGRAVMAAGDYSGSHEPCWGYLQIDGGGPYTQTYSSPNLNELSIWKCHNFFLKPFALDSSHFAKAYAVVMQMFPDSEIISVSPQPGYVQLPTSIKDPSGASLQDGIFPIGVVRRLK